MTVYKIFFWTNCKITHWFFGVSLVCSKSTNYLLERNYPVAEYNDMNKSGMCLILEKLPHLAYKAMDQYVLKGNAIGALYVAPLEGNLKLVHVKHRTILQVGLFVGFLQLFWNNFSSLLLINPAKVIDFF